MAFNPNSNAKPPIDISKNPFTQQNKAVRPIIIKTIRQNIMQFHNYVRAMQLTESETTMVQELLIALVLGIEKNYKAPVDERHKFSTRLMEIITREIKK